MSTRQYDAAPAPYVAEWIDKALPTKFAKNEARRLFSKVCFRRNGPYPVHTPFESITSTQFVVDFVERCKPLKESETWIQTYFKSCLVTDVIKFANPFDHLLGTLQRAGTCTLFIAVPNLGQSDADCVSKVEKGLKAKGYSFVFLFASADDKYAYMIMSLRNESYELKVRQIGRHLVDIVEPSNHFIPVTVIESTAMLAVCMSHVAFRRYPQAKHYDGFFYTFGNKSFDLAAPPLDFDDVRIVTDCIVLNSFHRQINNSIPEMTDAKITKTQSYQRFLAWSQSLLASPAKDIAPDRVVAISLVMHVISKSHLNTVTNRTYRIISENFGECGMHSFPVEQAKGSMVAFMVFSLRDEALFYGPDGIHSVIRQSFQLFPGACVMSVVPLDPQNAKNYNSLGVAMLSMISSPDDPQRDRRWRFLNHETSAAWRRERSRSPEAFGAAPGAENFDVGYTAERSDGRIKVERARSMSRGFAAAGPDRVERGRSLSRGFAAAGPDRVERGRSMSRGFDADYQEVLDNVDAPRTTQRKKQNNFGPPISHVEQSKKVDHFTPAVVSPTQVPLPPAVVQVNPTGPTDPRLQRPKPASALTVSIHVIVNKLPSKPILDYEYSAINFAVHPWTTVDLSAVKDSRRHPVSHALSNNFMLHDLQLFQKAMINVNSSLEVIMQHMKRIMIYKDRLFIIMQIHLESVNLRGSIQALVRHAHSWTQLGDLPVTNEDDFHGARKSENDYAVKPLFQKNDFQPTAYMVSMKRYSDNPFGSMYDLMHKMYLTTCKMAPDSTANPQVPWIKFTDTECDARKLLALATSLVDITRPIYKHYLDNFHVPDPMEEGELSSVMEESAFCAGQR